MKILLLGKDGQVGNAIQRTCPPGWELVSHGRSSAPLDDLRRTKELLAAERPDVIINAAAYTAVDRAEAEPDLAALVNRDAPALMAEAARETGAWLIHYSTDYVFDGRKAGAYAESDTPNPLSVYGRTKLEGDLAIAASGCRHLIFRVSWVYAFGHGNFPQTIFNLARERSSLNVVGDQIGAATDAAYVAEVTLRALAKIDERPDRTDLGGVYHLAPAGEVSRAELAKFIIAEAQALGAKLALGPGDVKAIRTADYPQPAVRPLNSRLDTGRLAQTLSIQAQDWRMAMRGWIVNAIRGTERDT